MNILKKNVVTLCVCVGGLILLFGCAKYGAQPINQLATCVSNKKEPLIAFAYKSLNKADCKRYLDRDVLAKGYQPIHITFSNNTNRYINFSKTNISIQCVSAAEVAQKVHTSTVTRATSYGVGAFFFLPLAIPAVVDGIGSSQANQKLDEDFSRKELCDQIVSPLSTINGLIFVPVEKFDPEFSIKLVDAESHDQFTLSTGKPILKI
ncbi:MAG: hypothetical protein ABIA74_04915 [bacterium]